MQFPNVKGRNLLQQNFSLPEDFDRPFTIVLLCFTMEQQLEVNTWLEFLGELKETHRDLEVYELPTLSKRTLLEQWLLDGWMRQGIPDQRTRATTITLYVNLREFANHLELPHLDSIFVVLVDRNGFVLHREAGAFSHEKSLRLTAQLEASRAGKSA
jgi:hypothetical protein